MALNILTSLQDLGIAQILLFLLSFAVVYGLLKQYKIPKSNAAQAMIGIAIAFLTIMATPVALVNVLTEMSANLILVAVGLLVLIIFLEVAGIKEVIPVKVPTGKKDDKGNPVMVDSEKEVRIFEKYGYAFAIVLGIIAILIFINAGGLALIGVQNINLSGASTTTVIFFIIILLAIFWLIGEKG